MNHVGYYFVAIPLGFGRELGSEGAYPSLTVGADSARDFRHEMEYNEC